MMAALPQPENNCPSQHVPRSLVWSSPSALLLALLLASSLSSDVALATEETKDTDRDGADDPAVPSVDVGSLLVDKVAQTTEDGQVDGAEERAPRLGVA